ncbi:hypothetical protein IG631_01193 [Alternaria alternata]|nr:hypothetical protein IG631_01193 [Alternaria alternata]
MTSYPAPLGLPSPSPLLIVSVSAGKPPWARHTLHVNQRRFGSLTCYEPAFPAAAGSRNRRLAGTCVALKRSAPLQTTEHHHDFLMRP